MDKKCNCISASTRERCKSFKIKGGEYCSSHSKTIPPCKLGNVFRPASPLASQTTANAAGPASPPLGQRGQLGQLGQIGQRGQLREGPKKLKLKLKLKDKGALKADPPKVVEKKQPIKLPSAIAKRFRMNASEFYNRALSANILEQQPQQPEDGIRPDLQLQLNERIAKGNKGLDAIMIDLKRSIKYGSLPKETFNNFIRRTWDDTKPWNAANPAYFEINYTWRLSIARTINEDHSWVDPKVYATYVIDAYYGNLKSGFLYSWYRTANPVNVGPLYTKFSLLDQPLVIDAGGVSRTIFSNIAEYFKGLLNINSSSKRYMSYFSPHLLDSNKVLLVQLGRFMALTMYTSNIIDLPIAPQVFEVIVTLCNNKNMFAQRHGDGWLRWDELSYETILTAIESIPLYKLIYLMSLQDECYSNELLNLVGMEDAVEYLYDHPQSIEGSESKLYKGKQGPILPDLKENLSLIETDKYKWYHSVLLRNLFGLKDKRMPAGMHYLVASFFDFYVNMREGYHLTIPLHFNILTKHFNTSTDLKIDEMFEIVDRMQMANIDNEEIVRDLFRRYIRESSPERWRQLLMFSTGRVNSADQITIRSGNIGKLPSAMTCHNSITIDVTVDYNTFATRFNISLDNLEGAFGFS